MRFVFIIAYLLFVVFFAKQHKQYIDRHGKAPHALSGLLHLLFAILYYLFWNLFGAIALLLFVRIVFDHSLSLFKRLGWNYYPAASKSIVDQIEKFIFRKKIIASIVELSIGIYLLTLK